MFNQYQSIEAIQIGIKGEPIRVLIIESGWKTEPVWYHVIEEHGDSEHSDYKFLSEEQIFESYSIRLKK